ncbi:MAG: hypothetical protein K2M34_02590 [Alphaproteobacteria bacterium]|nr:hypothetical protein [Alphaproteobacteria bacterium]
MNCKYKNLYKSIICMLMPVLAACGGKGSNTEGTDTVEAQCEPVVIHMPEMDSVIMRYSHEMDSIDALANKFDAAAKAYGDIYEVCKNEYDDFCAQYPYVNSTPRNKESLDKYLKENRAAMWDSAYHYDWEHRYVAQHKALYKENATLEALRPAKTALDSVNAQYDRAVVAERCYSDAWHKVLRDYQKEDSHRTVLNKPLREYQAKKLLAWSDSVVHYRARQMQLLAKKTELQKLK